MFAFGSSVQMRATSPTSEVADLTPCGASRLWGTLRIGASARTRNPSRTSAVAVSARLLTQPARLSQVLDPVVDCYECCDGARSEVRAHGCAFALAVAADTVSIREWDGAGQSAAPGRSPGRDRVRSRRQRPRRPRSARPRRTDPLKRLRSPRAKSLGDDRGSCGTRKMPTITSAVKGAAKQEQRKQRALRLDTREASNARQEKTREPSSLVLLTCLFLRLRPPIKALALPHDWRVPTP